MLRGPAKSERTPRPKKRFAQHFLRDPRVIDRLVAAIAPEPGQRLVEIGPGDGALTAPLLMVLGQLDVIEIDRTLAERLTQRLSGCGELRVHVADALRFPLDALGRSGERIRLVGNLPYNVSTPLLFHCLRRLDFIEDMIFMLQREVAERLIAPPGSRAYGRLSVMVQYRCQAEVLFEVESTAFYPRPTIQSSVLRLIPQPCPAPLRDAVGFEHLVRRAFSGRRKTMRNALKGQLSEAAYLAAGVDPRLRPEALAVSDFVRLSEHLLPVRRNSRDAR